MKKIQYLFVAAALLAGVTSCKQKAEEPESAKFTWYFFKDYTANLTDLSKAKANPDTVEMSDILCFVADADADSYVVWTGEPGRKFEERELSDELLKDTVNNVSKRAQGLALSAVDGKGRKYKTFSYSALSPVGEPFQVYATARNYSYETGEYAEKVDGPHSIVVIDTQTDLWGEDPQCANCTDYRMIAKAWDPTAKSGKGTMQKGTYEVLYEGSSKDVNGTTVNGPAVIMHFNSPCTLDSCQFIFKANNCIPVFKADDVYKYNTSGAVPLYYWTLDLTKGPVTLTLRSQSAEADAKSGDKYTADYTIYADVK